MGIEVIILLAGAIFYVFLSYVALRAGRELGNILASLYILTVALWVLGAALFVGSSSAHGIRAAILIEYISFIAAPLTFYVFARIFAQNTSLVPRVYYFVPLGCGLTLLASYLFFGIPDVPLIGIERLPRIVFHGALVLYFLAYVSLGHKELRNHIPRSTATPRHLVAVRIAAQIFTVPIFVGMMVEMGIIAFRLDALMWVGPVISLMVVIALPFIVRQYQNDQFRALATEVLVTFLWFLIFSRIVFAQSTMGRVVDTFLLILTTCMSFILLRGISTEHHVKRKLEKVIKELEMTNNTLKTLDRQKSSFVSIASHQLRTPVTAIRGYISMALEQSFGELNRATEQPLERIRMASEKLSRIVEDLLESSRIESGLKEFSFASVDVEAVVERVSEHFRSRFSEKNIAFSVVREGNDKNFFAVIDEEKIATVIRNVLEHAYATTTEGQVTVRIARDGYSNTIRIAISDTGAGVDQATLEAFFRVDRLKYFRRSKNNRWLWLYLADQILTAHHGTLWVESGGVGLGTTFFIEIPSSPTPV